MKINRIFQSIFLAIVIVGVFAAMARNAYGFTFMGVGCFGLAILYLIQLTWKVIEDHATMEKNDFLWVAELFVLAILVTLFGLRALYVYLPNAEFIFASTCVLLIIVYLSIAMGMFTTTNKENKELALNVLSLYTSVLVFLLAILTRGMTSWSVLFGVIAIVVSIPFLFSVARRQQFEYSDKIISLYQFVKSSRNKVGLLFLFFISSAVYTGLSRFGIIPEIENADRPKAYIELINDAESGKEKPVDGKYHHEKYKESMDQFLKRHSNSK